MRTAHALEQRRLTMSNGFVVTTTDSTLILDAATERDHSMWYASFLEVTLSRPWPDCQKPEVQSHRDRRSPHGDGPSPPRVMHVVWTQAMPVTALGARRLSIDDVTVASNPSPVASVGSLQAAAVSASLTAEKADVMRCGLVLLRMDAGRVHGLSMVRPKQSS